MALCNTLAGIAELREPILGVWLLSELRTAATHAQLCPFPPDMHICALALRHMAQLPAALACTCEDPARSRVSWNYLAEMMHHLLALLDQGMRLTRSSCGRQVFIGQEIIDPIR